MRQWTLLLRFFLATLTGGAALTACAPDDAESPAAGGQTEGPDAPRRVALHGVDLTGLGYDKGSADAPIVMVDFSDFGCPFCGQHARETQPALDKEFVATGKVFYKYVPFVMGMFPNGDLAARAAECAAEQGAFWEMHDALYVHQAAWKRGSEPADVFRENVARLGMDTARFAACYREGRGTARTRRATEAAQRLGIRATPTFFVNGRAIEGALPLDHFRRLLAEIAR